VDVKYFYRITADAFCGIGRPQKVTGLATFDKRVILFGSEGNVKIFSSKTDLGDPDQQALLRSNLPTAVVEAVDPICLDVKLVETCSGRFPSGGDLFEVPDGICKCFEDELVLSGDQKRLYATLGQFSIIKLERDSQLLLPAYDFCLPDKECIGGNENDPCELFAKIKFPVDEFFPPAACDYRDDQMNYKGCRE